jgi:hypothetical protein
MQGTVLGPNDPTPEAIASEQDKIRAAAVTLASRLDQECAGADNFEVLFALVIMLSDYLSKLPDWKARESALTDFAAAAMDQTQKILTRRAL